MTGCVLAMTSPIGCSIFPGRSARDPQQVSGTGMKPSPAIVAFALFTGLLSPCSTAGPRVSCNEPQWNFGTVTNGSVLRHSFVLRNVGDMPLEIRRLRACCQATAVAERKVLSAGETGRVDVVFSPSKRPLGVMQKAIYVSTNDATDPFFQLRLTGKISGVAPLAAKAPPGPPAALSDLVVVPHSLDDLSRAASDAGVSDEVRNLMIRSRSGIAFDIKGVFIGETSVQATWRFLNMGVVQITLSGASLVRLTDADALTVRTTHPECPEVLVSIRHSDSDVK